MHIFRHVRSYILREKCVRFRPCTRLFIDPFQVWRNIYIYISFDTYTHTHSQHTHIIMMWTFYLRILLPPPPTISLSLALCASLRSVELCVQIPWDESAVPRGQPAGRSCTTGRWPGPTRWLRPSLERILLKCQNDGHENNTRLVFVLKSLEPRKSRATINVTQYTYLRTLRSRYNIRVRMCM